MSKRLLLIVLILLFTLNISACGGKIEKVTERPVLSGIEFDESIDKLDIYLILRQEIDEAYLEKSAEYFNNKFGIELNVTASLALDILGLKMSQQLNSTGSSGLYLFSFSNIERIKELRDNTSILPMEEYLKDNPTWNALPSGMKSMYELSDGMVWAIPRGFTPVVMGRIFRQDYLEELDLEVPDDLDSLYEVTNKLKNSDPDKNGINDTFGMVYASAAGFRDIFYANGVPVNTSNDGFHNTSISYNRIYNSFEDSMLMENMETTLEYILRMDEEGLVRLMRSRYTQTTNNILKNNSIANTYIRIPDQVFIDDRFVISNGLRGSESEYLNPLTYDYTDGFYVLGADTGKPSQTINTFVSLFFGDLEGYLFASRGIQGDTYSVEMGSVEVLDYNFFSINHAALVGDNPLYTYEVMDITLNTELTGMGILTDIIDIDLARDIYIATSKEERIMYDISIDRAYPEVFIPKAGEIINSAAATIFDAQFSRILSGRASIKDSIAIYVRDMKKLGMQDIINELNHEIGERTNYKY